jgi:adenylate cyclase
MTADQPPMTIDLAREPVFAIGPLSVSPSTREVSAGDIEEILEPRVMQVLVALARGAGAVVSRDDLVQSCWGGRIVGDDAVHRCIAKVRRLGEATGAFELETIPKVGYRLSEAESAASPTAAAPPAVASAPILAVLPFDNLSGDPELLFFSDGVSEEILHALSRNANLRVIGRASSFQFRSPNKVVRTIAGELKTSHLLDGSVRRAGNRVRVSAHLLDTSSQTMVWSDRFDRDLADIFALQDEIAANVSAALDIRFAPQRATTVSAEAYDIFLRGSVWSRDVSLESQRRALGLLEEAVDKAPDLARAWGELALTRAQLRYLGAGDAITRESVQDAAERALALDVRAQGAWGALYLAIPPFEFLEAEALYKRARRAGFGLPLIRSIHLFDVGRTREALEDLDRARSIDPFQQMQLFYAAVAELTQNETALAAQMLREATDRWPQVPFIAANAVVWSAAAGDWAEAERLLDPERLKRHPMAPWTESVALRLSAMREGLKRTFFQDLRKAELASNSTLADTVAFAGAADPDVVFSDDPAPVNRQALRRPELGMAALWLPHTARLRKDPRFAVFCTKIGLTAYWQETGVWPDCTDDLPYDFRAACRAAL